MSHDLVGGPSFQDIVDALPVALVVLDEEQKVVMANRSFSSLLMPQECKKGMLFLEFFPHEGLQRQLWEVKREGGRRQVELHLFRPQDVIKAIKATVIGFITQGTAGRYCLVLLEDISEHIRLEQQLVQSEKLAAMGELAASVAHELGNPLSAMSATLEYMQQRLHRTNASLAKELEVMRDNVSRMHELLKSLAEFTGPEQPHVTRDDIRRGLSQVLTFVAKEAEARKVIVETAFEPIVPACWADHRKLKQVFLNLLKNALEAMPGGGRLAVRVKLVGAAAAAKEPCLAIEVSDTGVGIREAEMETVFRPFYSTKSGGRGLGLPFCRRVIEEHGGEIRLHSQWGKGTTVAIWLPLASEREEDGAAQDHPGDR